jgi:hypothetical protein
VPGAIGSELTEMMAFADDGKCERPAAISEIDIGDVIVGNSLCPLVRAPYFVKAEHRKVTSCNDTLISFSGR